MKVLVLEYEQIKCKEHSTLYKRDEHKDVSETVWRDKLSVYEAEIDCSIALQLANEKLNRAFELRQAFTNTLCDLGKRNDFESIAELLPSSLQVSSGFEVTKHELRSEFFLEENLEIFVDVAKHLPKHGAIIPLTFGSIYRADVMELSLHRNAHKYGYNGFDLVGNTLVQQHEHLEYLLELIEHGQVSIENEESGNSPFAGLSDLMK